MDDYHVLKKSLIYDSCRGTPLRIRPSSPHSEQGTASKLPEGTYPIILNLIPPKLKPVIQLWYTVGFLQPTLLAITKLSVLVLFYRIFAKPLFRFFVWILGAIVILWWIGAFFADALICIPVQHNWDPEVPGHCGNKNLLAIITPIPWIVTDLVIVLMPLPMVWHLHLPRLQRVGLGILFLLGGLYITILR